MSVELIKYAFSAGELSRSLYGRTDLTKYDLGVALARNWFVDYRGGLSTRPGTEFLDYIKADDKETKFFEFRFSPELSNTYVLLFGDHYLRFIQDGAYVLEEGKAIEGIYSNIIYLPSHGFEVGDWVKLRGAENNPGLEGRTFEIIARAPSTFTVVDAGSLEPPEFVTGAAGGFASRIYEIPTQYSSDDLGQLSTFQIRDFVRITHPNFPVNNLIRNDHTDWEFEEDARYILTTPPTGLTLKATTPDEESNSRASVSYAVSAVTEDGNESPASRPRTARNIVNFVVEAGSVALSWDPVPGADHYNIYRTHVVGWSTRGTSPETQWIDEGAEMGYLGMARGTTFVDSNIVPDFGKNPVIDYDPFAVGAVDQITVVDGGSGYPYAAPITVSGGDDFLGHVITDVDGVITGVVIQRAGRNFTSSSIATVSGGTGAILTLTVKNTEDLNNPSISTLFQQRQMYAASLNNPLTIWGSQVKRYNNFIDDGTDAGGYEFELDSAEVAPIRHMLAMRGGLLLMSQTGIWLLTGAPQGGPVTPTNALADPQDYTGVSRVPPLKIGTDLLYIEGKGTSVRLLSYNDFSKVYSGEDQSILSAHLFGPDKQVVRWVFSDNPYKLVYGVRSDGVLLMFTIVKEQDVFAWTWGQTYGQFRDILSITEDGFDRVYVAVQRLIGGRWRKYLERFAPREFHHIEDAWAVDAGLGLTPPPVPTTLTISTEEVVGENRYVTLTAGDPTFTATEGWFVRAGGGIFIISEVLSPTEARAFVRESVTEVIPETPDRQPYPIDSDDWTFSPGYTSLSGLHHLEGLTVSILGDGNVFPRQTVVDGRIDLPEKVSKAVVGIPFTAVAQTLPPVVTDVPVEAKRKRVVGVAVRLSESRGLLAGRALDELYEFKNRTNEPYAAPTRVINGFKHILLSTEWDEDGQTYFVQEDPLPASILGLLPDLDFGDDND